MDVSEIRVKLVRNPKERLKAVCSVTFDSEFVIRDLKVIDGASGLFVAMPSRKLADHCPKCRTKNHLRARFCNECGQKLDEGRADRVRGGRPRLHADVAHPINSQCRSRIQANVVEAYQEELERSKEPGYQPQEYDDVEHDAGDAGGGYDSLVADLKKDAKERRSDSGRREDDGASDITSSDAEPAEESVEPEHPAVSESERPAVSEPEPPPPSESASSPLADDSDFGAGIA